MSCNQISGAHAADFPAAEASKHLLILQVVLASLGFKSRCQGLFDRCCWLFFVLLVAGRSESSSGLHGQASTLVDAVISVCARVW
jgi:hypothetical protein